MAACVRYLDYRGHHDAVEFVAILCNGKGTQENPVIE